VHIGEHQPAAAAALERLVRGEPWLLGVLAAARACGAPDCWVGGGVLRDLVWDQLDGEFDPARVKDVDVAFYDPGDLTPEADQAVEVALRRLAPEVPWDAKNQASVHLWYEQRFGDAVEPLRSAADGVATWPETATAVAVAWTTTTSSRSPRCAGCRTCFRACVAATPGGSVSSGIAIASRPNRSRPAGPTSRFTGDARPGPAAWSASR
jgi:hypothetical protein